MIINCDLNLLKEGQLKNILLHNLDNSSQVTTSLTKESQIGYQKDIGRMVVFSDKVNYLATLNDVDNARAMYYQDDEPTATMEVPISDGSFWYSPTREDGLRIYNADLAGWKIVYSNEILSSSIPEWDIDVVYLDSVLVVHNNILYQNQTGTDNNDSVWTVGNWTQIGASSSAGEKANYNITTAQLDNTTINSVYRSGNTYRITHSLSVEYPQLNVYLLSTGEHIEVEYKILSENTIILDFGDYSLPENILCILN